MNTQDELNEEMLNDKVELYDDFVLLVKGIVDDEVSYASEVEKLNAIEEECNKLQHQLQQVNKSYQKI